MIPRPPSRTGPRLAALSQNCIERILTGKRGFAACVHPPSFRHINEIVGDWPSPFPFGAGARRGILQAMKAVASRPVPARPLALPNLLTYSRIAAVPMVVGCLYYQDILQGGLLSLIHI